DLLRNLNGRTRVSLVVATDQHKLGGLAVELNLLFVRFFKGEREAVPHVFAVMRLRAGERCRKAQFDDLFRRSRGNGKGGQGSGRGGQQLETGSGLHDCLHVWNGGDDGIHRHRVATALHQTFNRHLIGCNPIKRCGYTFFCSGIAARPQADRIQAVQPRNTTPAGSEAAPGAAEDAAARAPEPTAPAPLPGAGKVAAIASASPATAWRWPSTRADMPTSTGTLACAVQTRGLADLSEADGTSRHTICCCAMRP